MTRYLCIEDTDVVDSEVGTGRRSRLLAADLGDAFPSFSLVGCVRQQLLVDPRVPYTTHNSCACIVFEGGPSVDDLEALVGDHLASECPEGSDPGLCIADDEDVSEGIVAYGRDATEDVVTESDAYALADEAGVFLDEYGGTGEGVIGALAGVGLTSTGDSGRFVEFGRIREYGESVDVSTLRDDGIAVVTDTGDAVGSGSLATRGWVRPELRGGEPTLVVTESAGEDDWVARNALDR